MAIAYVIQEQVRGCRTVAFDEHAVKRMTERKVSEDEVLQLGGGRERLQERQDPRHDLSFRGKFAALAGPPRADVPWAAAYVSRPGTSAFCGAYDGTATGNSDGAL